VSHWTTVAGVVLVAAGAAAGVAVSGQVREVEPPKMTVANKVTNPVPVSAVITGVADSVRIELSPDTIANLKDNVVVRLAPVEWEYRELRLPTAPANYQSIMGQLRTAGAEGWETTGVSFSDTAATVVILKRAKTPG
jgi:hypothetical protein